MPDSIYSAGKFNSVPASTDNLATAVDANKSKGFQVKANGLSKPSGQARTQARTTKLSRVSSNTPTGATPSGKTNKAARQPGIKARIRDFNDKVEQPINATSSAARNSIRSGYDTRVRISNAKNESITQSTDSGRAKVPTSSRKPLLLQSEAESWKLKYEEQLKNLQQAQSEKEDAERKLDKHVTEHSEKVAASESRRRLAETEVVNLGEQLVDAQANLEQCRQQNHDLSHAHEELSIQIDHACDRIKELEAQAKLAGELQTELNGLRNVHLPSLKQENKVLKQELRQILDDIKSPSDTPNLTPLRSQGKPVVAYHHDANESTVAAQDLLQESQVYIDQLEKSSDWFESMYTGAAFEADDLERQVAAFQTTTGHLKEENHDLVCGGNKLTRDIEEPQTDKRVLRVVNVEPRISSTVSVVSTVAGVVSTVQTEPSFPLKPASTFSGIMGRIDADDLPLQKLGITGISTVAIQPVDNAPTHMPRPPLDQDLQITINIEASSRAKFSLLKRLGTITTKGTTFKINGPEEIAKALAHGMEEARARVAHTEAKVLELQQMMWAYIQEIDELKMSGCNMILHNTQADDLAAMEARLQMQDTLLADYGRQLARLNHRHAIE